MSFCSRLVQLSKQKPNHRMRIMILPSTIGKACFLKLQAKIFILRETRTTSIRRIAKSPINYLPPIRIIIPYFCANRRHFYLITQTQAIFIRIQPPEKYLSKQIAKPLENCFRLSRSTRTSLPPAKLSIPGIVSRSRTIRLEPKPSNWVPTKAR